MKVEGALRRSIVIAAALLVLPVGMGAQETDSARVEELMRRIEIITQEIERLRLGSDVAAEADTSILGFGPAASKVYKLGQGVSVGGYGEVLYESFSDEREDGIPSGASDTFDALRGIVYVGYKFNDKLLFNSEIELEHGSTDQAGSASLEFAYVDYRISDSFGLRGGLLLAPLGFVNELHEPPVFLGTRRPLTENRIIPTTWRENGVGVFGGTDRFSYRAYLMTSLDGVGGGSSGADGFGASGLRGGRQKGSKAVAESFSLAGRLDYVGTLGLTLGTSLYLGNSGHGRTLDSGETVDARTLIWEGHGEYKARGLDLRALVAVATVDEAARLNELKDLAGSGSVGERLTGWYVQAGYDLLRGADTSHQLIPYARIEQVNTQAEVPDGFSSDPGNDVRVVSLGAAWKPLPSVVLKSDYEIHSTEAETGVNQLNVALGYLF